MRARIAKKKLKAMSALYNDLPNLFPDWFELHFNALFITALDQSKARGHWGSRPTDDNSPAFSMRNWQEKVWWENADSYISNGKLGCFKKLYKLANHFLNYSRRDDEVLLWVTSEQPGKPVPMRVARNVMIHEVANLLGYSTEQIVGFYIWSGMPLMTYMAMCSGASFIEDSDLLILPALPEDMPTIITKELVDANQSAPCANQAQG